MKPYEKCEKSLIHLTYDKKGYWPYWKKGYCNILTKLYNYVLQSIWYTCNNEKQHIYRYIYTGLPDALPPPSNLKKNCRQQRQNDPPYTTGQPPAIPDPLVPDTVIHKAISLTKFSFNKVKNQHTPMPACFLWTHYKTLHLVYRF